MISIKSNYLAILGLSLCLLSSQSAAQTKFSNSNAITPPRLRSHLEFIASDELGGRETPSLGLDIASKYVASQLQLWGAQPAGDNGTFFQKVMFRLPQLDPDKSSVELGEKRFTYGAGIQSANMGFKASGRMVYVGHGFMIKKLKLDPYAGLDVKGKILVVARGFPEGVSSSELSGTPGEDYAWPALAAKNLGAAGIVVIADSFQTSLWDRELSLSLGAPELDDPATDIPPDAVGQVIVGPEVAKEIFRGEKVTAEDAAKGGLAPNTSFELSPSKTLHIDAVSRTIRKPAYNVVARIPGTDPVLKNEFVAYGCHIDHLGTRLNGTNDRIFNGADDDGSGVVALLEIAHAILTGPRPKRSSLFIWHVGEEMGMLGSKHFTDNPTVDLSKVVAMLNIDMIGRSKIAGDTKPRNRTLTGPNEIYVVGSTMMSTDLHRTSESVNSKFLNMAFNYKFDDPNDPARIFYRSDHYMYARKGIPILFYYSGEHEDYHRPTDELSKIDFEKLTRVTRTIYALGWTLGNAKTRPKVDKQLPKEPETRAA